MKSRSMLIAAALLVAGGWAAAQEMFIPYDTDGCATYAPFTWTEVVPGGVWQATVDLSQCTADQLGMFRYYGYIVRNNSADTLKSRYGFMLMARDLGTGQEYTLGGRKGDDHIMVKVDRPTTIQLIAENRGRTTEKIRLTWVREQL